MFWIDDQSSIGEGYHMVVSGVSYRAVWEFEEGENYSPEKLYR